MTFNFRACRLKKKAQHEANKVKLYGLEQEHRKENYFILHLNTIRHVILFCSGKLMAAISQTKLMITGKYDTMIAAQNAAAVPQQDASARLERIAKSLTSSNCHGFKSDYYFK